MTLSALQTERYFLYDGPMETRIQFDAKIAIPEDAAIFQLVFQDAGRQALIRVSQCLFQSSLRIPCANVDYLVTRLT